MKKFQFSFLYILILTTGFSCKKFLNTVPIDSVAPENFYRTESELQRALAGVYDRLGDLRVYGAGMNTYLAFSDEFVTKSSSGILGNVISSSTTELNRCWESLYSGVNRANLLLANINKSTSISEEKRNEIKGQALFLRGYYYFLLVDMFGPVPLKTQPSSPADPALPVSSLVDIYKQITSDMKDAEKLVRDITDYGFNGRITKTAVQGILARVYLTMAGHPLLDDTKYADALFYANEVKGSGMHSLSNDYKQLFINHSQDKYDIQECIWEIEFAGNNTGAITEGGTLGSYMGIACTDLEVGYGQDQIHTSLKLWDAYEAWDLRRDWNIAPFRYVTTNNVTVKTNWLSTEIYQRSAGKWRREFELVTPRTRDYTPANYPVLRFADVLLMYAEASYHENGVTADAVLAINQVRRRGAGKDIMTPDAAIDLLNTVSDEDFVIALRQERFRELAFEGIRKHDLVRWGVYYDTMKTFEVQLKATVPPTLTAMYSVAANTTERNVLFPIPNSELSVNTQLIQNEGW